MVVKMGKCNRSNDRGKLRDEEPTEERTRASGKTCKGPGFGGENADYERSLKHDVLTGRRENREREGRISLNIEEKKSAVKRPLVLKRAKGPVDPQKKRGEKTPREEKERRQRK